MNRQKMEPERAEYLKGEVEELKSSLLRLLEQCSYAATALNLVAKGCDSKPARESLAKFHETLQDTMDLMDEMDTTLYFE